MFKIINGKAKGPFGIHGKFIKNGGYRLHEIIRMVKFNVGPRKDARRIRRRQE